MPLLRIFLCSVMLSSVIFSQPPELGQGWLPEFNMASRQLLALAEATPADKFGWRPAPGVRSISEVYVHIASSNLWFLQQAGLPIDMSKVPSDGEKTITAKADVIKWLKYSAEAVRANYPNADRQKRVRFLNQSTTSDAVLLRLLAHTNEHMGQSVAYARMIAVVPPWSQ